jgi:hypothetical protein
MLKGIFGATFPERWIGMGRFSSSHLGALIWHTLIFLLGACKELRLSEQK